MIQEKVFSKKDIKRIQKMWQKIYSIVHATNIQQNIVSFILQPWRLVPEKSILKNLKPKGPNIKSKRLDTNGNYFASIEERQDGYHIALNCWCGFMEQEARWELFNIIFSSVQDAQKHCDIILKEKGCILQD